MTIITYQARKCWQINITDDFYDTLLLTCEMNKQSFSHITDPPTETKGN